MKETYVLYVDKSVESKATALALTERSIEFTPVIRSSRSEFDEIPAIEGKYFTFRGFHQIGLYLGIGRRLHEIREELSSSAI